MKNFLDLYFQLVSRLVPSQGSSFLGLDIGNSSVKAVVFHKTLDKYVIDQCFIESITESNLKEILPNLIKKNNLAGHSIVTGVSGKGTLIRYIDFPRMSLEDLRKSFAIEADKYFPFDQNTIYTDCCILDPQGKDKRMSVLVAAVKREILDVRIKLLAELGVYPQEVTINSLSLANIGELHKYSKPSVVGDQATAQAYLDIGHSVSSLMILQNGIPRFTRDIFIGGIEFTKKIANLLNLGLLEAEALKCAPATRLEEINRACENTTLNLVSEIRLSLDYFITEKNIQVDTIFLSGGGALMEGIAPAFEKNLDVPVKILECPVELQFASDVVRQDFQRNFVRYVSALGCAL